VNGVPLIPAHDPVDLPAARDGRRDSVLRPTLALAERQFPIAEELEVVRAVEPGDRLIPLQHRDPVPGQTGILIVGVIHRARKRVREADHRPLDAACRLHLQAVVIGGVERREVRDVRDASEGREQRAAVIAAARSRGVDVLDNSLPDGAAADVRGLNIEPGAGIALHGEVV